MLKHETQSIELYVPDDFHHHLRDGEVLRDVVNYASEAFDYILVMPNINPPVRKVKDAEEYLKRILDSQTKNYVDSRIPTFLMTLYLTDKTSPQDIQEVSKSKNVVALKMYPAGATTNSEFGVTCIDSIKPALQEMAKHGIPLLVHGEVTDSEIDIFDREKVFIERILKPILKDIPELKVVMEHITTKHAVDFVMNYPKDNLAATITAHHLLYNRNALFQGGLRPHMYCLPVLKREEHRKALIKAAVSGSEKFFLGTDSAPHTIDDKESACGCAGIFTGHAPLELYAEAFSSVDKLNMLPDFANKFGRKFYGDILNKIPSISPRQKIILTKETWKVPNKLHFGSKYVKPLRAAESIFWKVARIL